jgi:hypothetical protein
VLSSERKRRERLLAMDARFVERVERAFKTCDKNRQAAAATYDANPARGALEVGRRSVAAYLCPARAPSALGAALL